MGNSMEIYFWEMVHKSSTFWERFHKSSIFWGRLSIAMFDYRRAYCHPAPCLKAPTYLKCHQNVTKTTEQYHAI